MNAVSRIRSVVRERRLVCGRDERRHGHNAGSSARLPLLQKPRFAPARICRWRRLAASEAVLETIRELGNTRSFSLPLQPDGGYAAVVNPK